MLDLVSEGRAYVGIAKGAWLDRLGLEEEHPLAALREAVEIVTKLLAGDASGVEGGRFQLAPGTILAYERARERVPLLIGTWGRHTAAWAGTVADEVKLGGSANPDLVPVMREWLGADGVRIVVGCVTVVDEDGGWARERAKARVAPYLEVVAHRDPTLELGPDRSLRSSGLRSPARRRRLPRASSSCGLRAWTGSSSEPLRGGRRRQESS